MSFRYKKKFPIQPTRKLINDKNQLEYTQGDVLNLGNKTTNIVKKIGIKHVGNHTESDIFNQKKRAISPRMRVNPTNKKSSILNQINVGAEKEIQEYTKEKRCPKKEYDPTPYYTNCSATEKKINFFYGSHF